MEVTSLNFESLFPTIIDAYTRCAFIAIDCEFSGVRAFDANDVPIRTSLRDGANLTSSEPGADPTEEREEVGQASAAREEAYRRLKSAAQKYTVLQLGITFVCIDDDRKDGDLFKTETYSFLVNPFVDWSNGEGVRICKAIERDVTVNSASVQFLQSTKFNLRALLTEGLGYLTYDEEKKAKEYVNGHPRNRILEAEKGKQEEERAENERIHSVITEWLVHNGTQTEERLRLFPPGGKPMTRSWTSRVHTIVRNQFKDCRSWKDPREHCVVVKHVDVAEEEERQKERERRIGAAIRKAVGLRNVLDLILGNDLSEKVIPGEFAEAQLRATELEDWPPKPAAEKDIERETAIKNLTEKLNLLKILRAPPILVGQNLGWDIAFLTEAFLRPLPDTLEEFVRVVDGMFPRLLDTRVVAANHADEFKDLDLFDIHSALMGQGLEPRCYYDPGMGYRSDSAHDAGYDSFITAEVFLKMGQKLVVQEREGRGGSKRDQASINREIIDWNSPVWEPFRGRFMVHGQMARE